MRKLQTHDVFMALKVIRAAGMKEEIKNVATLVQEAEKRKIKIKIEDVGFEFIFGVLEKLAGTEAEDSIYNLLSGPLEIDASEIKIMDPFELVEKIKAMKEVVNLEQAKSFFKSVAALMEKLN